jgi:hypothetical protein
LHIDSDGLRGQFTKYLMRSPNRSDATIEITARLKVVANAGRAATLSLPFVGKLRFFPDRVQLAHEPTVRADVEPGKFHTYRVVSDGKTMTLLIDGRQQLTTDKLDRRVRPLAWSALKPSVYPLGFGNEACPDGSIDDDWAASGKRSPQAADKHPPPRTVYLKNITPAVSGYSIWQQVTVKVEEAKSVRRRMHWQAGDDAFPDQYQLDHILEVQGTISGVDQGYSGWVQLTDGRIFVVNYTDDTARWNAEAESPHHGVSWIRGTYVLPSDLPPLKRNHR